jgi:putative ABC transport system substrate-binding protein
MKKNSELIAQRSALWLAVCALLFALRVPAEAQQQTKVSKIGWLSARGAANIGQETIVGMLRDLGYVEGKNVAYEYRFADDKLDRLPALAEELVRLKVDVLVTPGTPGALALKKATQTNPIVFTDVTDPVAAGLVDSLARPEATSRGSASIEAVWLANVSSCSKETVSKLSRVAVLWDPQNQTPHRNGERANAGRTRPATSFHGSK